MDKIKRCVTCSCGIMYGGINRIINFRAVAKWHNKEVSCSEICECGKVYFTISACWLNPADHIRVEYAPRGGGVCSAVMWRTRHVPILKEAQVIFYAMTLPPSGCLRICNVDLMVSMCTWLSARWT